MVWTKQEHDERSFWGQVMLCILLPVVVTKVETRKTSLSCLPKVCALPYKYVISSMCFPGASQCRICKKCGFSLFFSSLKAAGSVCCWPRARENTGPPPPQKTLLEAMLLWTKRRDSGEHVGPELEALRVWKPGLHHGGVRYLSNWFNQDTAPDSRPEERCRL